MTKLHFSSSLIWWTDTVNDREQTVVLEKIARFHREANGDVLFYGTQNFLSLARDVDDTSYAIIPTAIRADQMRRSQL